MKASLTEE
jgi:hypothetical protein